LLVPKVFVEVARIPYHETPTMAVDALTEHPRCIGQALEPLLVFPKVWQVWSGSLAHNRDEPWQPSMELRVPFGFLHRV
jgi:hypothetical protein